MNKSFHPDELTLARQGGAEPALVSAERGREAPPPRARMQDFSTAQIGLIFLGLTLLSILPILSNPLPPLSDYVNHLARMHVIMAGASDPDLSRFYQIEWAIIPNLVMDFVVPVIHRVMDVYLAGQMFTVLTFVVIMSGTLALNRALFGHWSVLPLIGFPLLYNGVFLVGVMNYVFGIGVALWALAAWIMLRAKPWLLRAAVSALFVVALFFCHLFSAGIYGVGLLAYELRQLWKHRQQPLTPRLVAFCAAGLPFLPVVLLLIRSPTWDLSGENYWEPRGKIDGIVFALEVYSDFVAFGLAAVVIAAAIWAMRHRLLRFHSLTTALILVSGLIYLCMPRVLFGTYMADQRLPIAIGFMLVACTHLELRHRLVRRGFLALLVLLLLVRVAEVEIAWSNLSKGLIAFRESSRLIERGATVLVAYADKGSGEDVRDYGFVHAACFAMIERSALVTTAFTVRGKQILQVRPAYRGRVDTEDGTPPSVYQLLVAQEPDHQAEETPPYWDGWPAKYDYLYVLFTEADADNPNSDQLKLVHEGPRFQLYRILKPGEPRPEPDSEE